MIHTTSNLINNKMRLLIFFAFASLKLHAQEHTFSKQVSTFTIIAPQLNTSKKIWIYLPKEYELSNRKYPVLYMHDAQNLFDKKSSYAGEWEVDETLDGINAKVIVIGIEHGNNERINELTPFAHPIYIGAQADKYLEFIVKTLKPHIDSTLRTKKLAKDTGIMGSSLGGLVSMYAVLKYPITFGKAGIFSPSFWYSEKIYQMMESAPKLSAKIFLLSGDKEDTSMVPDLNKMHLLLDKNRCSCKNLSKKKIVADGQHNEKLWRENFKEAFEWLF